MRYPALSPRMARELAKRMIKGEIIDKNSYWIERGEGKKVDRSLLHALGVSAGEAIENAGAPTSDRDRVEGAACSALFEQLNTLPVEVLDDQGFWAYISIFELWDFVVWREELTNNNVGKYVDGTSQSECIALRMFIRGQALSLGGNSDLAGEIPNATDFWRSHVTRVRTSTSPNLVVALAESQAEERLTTQPLRDLAKRLNRLWSNVSLVDYTAAEARELVEEQRSLLESMTQSTTLTEGNLSEY